jgi:hypothetical protein
LVRFGTVGGTRLRVVSAGVIEVMAPRHGPGGVDVAVVNRVGTSRVSPADRYSFKP